MIKCSPLEIQGAVPTVTGGEATLYRNRGSNGRPLQRTPRDLTNSAAGREPGLSVTLTNSQGEILAPCHELPAGLALGSDSSKKAKPPAEPREVLQLRACAQNPTATRGREDSLCCTARIYRPPCVGSTNLGSKIKYFLKVLLCCWRVLGSLGPITASVLNVCRLFLGHYSLNNTIQ